MTGARAASTAAHHAFESALLEDDPELLYDRAPCGYLTTSPDGTLVKVNQTFLAWTGHTREELVGRRTFAELLTAGGRIYHETHYAPMLRMQGSAREIALDVVTAGGERLPVLVNAVLESDAAGRPVLVRVALFDATERREYERELLRAKDRAEQSEAHARALAHTLQQTLMPPVPPSVPGLDVAAAFRPAGAGTEVGGDFYDVFQVADDDWVVALGDVCGKGVEAAVVTALVRHTVRALSVRTSDPAQVLDLLNEVMLARSVDRFCTVLVLRLRRPTPESPWQATLSCGGHPLPLLVRADGTAPRMGTPGTLVGAFPAGRRTDTEVELAPGDVLLLFTDGVTEARQGQRFYDEHQLRRLVEEHRTSADLVTRAVLDDVMQFQQGVPRDDIALVAVRVPDSPTPGGGP